MSGSTAKSADVPAPSTSYLNNFQIAAPTLRCRPDLVQGMPVARDTRRLAFVTPNWRFQLQPPLFMTPPRYSPAAPGRNRYPQAAELAHDTRAGRFTAAVDAFPTSHPTVRMVLDRPQRRVPVTSSMCMVRADRRIGPPQARTTRSPGSFATIPVGHRHLRSATARSAIAFTSWCRHRLLGAVEAKGTGNVVSQRRPVQVGRNVTEMGPG